jgi:hypothetical protein
VFVPEIGPFAMEPDQKRAWLVAQLGELVAHHSLGCDPYARMVDVWNQNRRGQPESAEDFPFIPVGIFKEYSLRSTKDPVMSLRSSATSTGSAATIYVDKATRQRQSLSANQILADFIGAERRPYIVFDLERTVRGADAMSARGAAIMSLANLATEFYFVLREDNGVLTIDETALAKALEAIGPKPFVAYGFTYILYQSHEEIQARSLGRPVHPDSVFLHSGGWKRLQEQAVDKPAFNRSVAAPWRLNTDRVIDFYGLVEQVGVLYPDCSEGMKHVPYWAEVIVRRADSLEPAAPGEAGLLQLVNVLPLSAPNHSVLTEDLGAVVLDDGCPCGRRGRAFVFRGRAPRAELRGCSDVWRG